MNPSEAAESIRLGKTFEEVAQEVGLSRQRVWQIINRWSVTNGDTIAIGKRPIKRFVCPFCKRKFSLSNQQIKHRMGKRRESKSKLPVEVQYCSPECAHKAIIKGGKDAQAKKRARKSMETDG